MLGYFVVWYVSLAPVDYWRYFKRLTGDIAYYFSIPELLETLVDPWRHDAIDISQVPFNYKLRAVGQNFISRLIGFAVRAMTIIIGLLVIVATMIGGFSLFVIWYIWPLVVVWLIVFGFRLMVGGV